MQKQVEEEHQAAHERYANIVKQHLGAQDNPLGPLAGAEKEYLDVHAASIERVQARLADEMKSLQYQLRAAEFRVSKDPAALLPEI